MHEWLKAVGNSLLFLIFFCSVQSCRVCGVAPDVAGRNFTSSFSPIERSRVLVPDLFGW
jgi:hypothetical protein